MTATIRLGYSPLALLAASTSWSMGSAEAGAAKSATCLACHVPNGNSSNPEFPSLAGQNAAYIERQLHLLHDGGRTGKTGDVNAAMMPAMASTLGDQDIEDVAAYYSQQSPIGLEADPSYWHARHRLYRNADLVRRIPAFAACHGPLGLGKPTPGYPARLAPQSG